MDRTRFFKLLALVAALPALPAAAQNFDDVLEARLLTGWRQADGSHMAALQLDLAPGWKTYWRAPGDAGIPPIFNMTGSGNLSDAQVVWPRPEFFMQNGMRSIGYEGRVVLPMRVMPRQSGADIELRAQVEIGICEEICIPQTLNISALLPAQDTAKNAKIRASLADVPFSGAEAGASNVTCALEPSEDGMQLTARFSLPPQGRGEAVVIETANPLLWVAEPDVTRRGNTVTAVTELQHVDGKSFAIKRDGVTITVLSAKQAVEIKGCARG
jgi:DsbC/DsbD-like thiol-disulfide interchange protein